VSADIKAVGARIETWRRTRKKRSPMPEDLWRAAAVLAQSHGVYSISQALRVRYETLRSWTAKGEGAAAATTAHESTKFVEVALAGPPAGEGPVVELGDAGGAKLTIRLPAGSMVDIAEVARAWRRSGR
jgi:hypothetical protein